MDINTQNKPMVFPKVKKIILITFIVAFAIGGYIAYMLYGMILDPNVKNEQRITIARGASLDMVVDSLEKYDVLIDIDNFRWVAKQKDYSQYISAGIYAFTKGQSTNDIVNMLIAKNQVPTMVTFNNLRFMNQLAGKLAQQIEPDSLTMLQYLTDSEVYTKYGFDEHTFHAMFIPNTYEMYWTTTPEQFVERMNKEYKRFWTSERLAKAKALYLTPVEVETLASIVQEETARNDEKPMVAGLYLNRLRKGMLLQADPTLKFAAGDFSIRRVLNKHKKIESPYNTYLYTGLPPGPINFPEISSINAVLNPAKHNYIYMCAKEDFSGYHNFARSLSQHNANARRYQRALNERRIYN